MNENEIRRDLLAFARPDLGAKEKEAVLRVLDSGWLSSGPETKRFESEFSKFLSVENAIALSSCTAALHLAAAAWELGKDDAVLVPAITFTATAEIFAYFDCLPLILDVARDDYLFSANIVREFIKEECHWRNNVLVHCQSKRRIRVLVPVHLGGRSCDMDALSEIASEYNLKILDDAAHCFPGSYKGHFIGGLADATAFSFYATKNLSTGEGGMLTTNDNALAKKIRVMRLHGIGLSGQSYERSGYRYDVICDGYKYNMMDMCAALGRVQLKRSLDMLKKRQAIHNLYDEKLKDIHGLALNPKYSHESAYHLYTIEILENFGLKRDRFIDEMRRRNIALSLHFIPLYHFSHYRKKYDLDASNYPNAEAIYKGIVSLPIYSAMSLDDAADIVQAIYNICA